MIEQWEVTTVSRVHRDHPSDWHLNFVFVFVLVLIANFRQPKENANERGKETRRSQLTASHSFFLLIKIQSLLSYFAIKISAQKHTHTGQVRFSQTFSSQEEKKLRR